VEDFAVHLGLPSGRVLMKEEEEVLKALEEIKELLKKIHDELQRKPLYIVIQSPPYHYSGPTLTANPRASLVKWVTTLAEEEVEVKG
jgi:tRNA G26 N,N-dimethylase Trm1